MAGSRGHAARRIEVVRSDGRRITLAEQRRTLWQDIVRARVAYLSLLPLFLALGIFVYFPPLSAMYHAFFDWNPSGQSTFVGLGNFQTMLSDNVLASSFQDSANDGFHEAIGDTMALSTTPEYLKQIGLLAKVDKDNAAKVLSLLRRELLYSTGDFAALEAEAKNDRSRGG